MIDSRYLIQGIINGHIARKSNSIIEKKVKLSGRSKLHGRNRICRSCEVVTTELGFGSYIGIETKLYNTKIGKYCCIGPYVLVATGEHPTKEFVSIHPAFYSLKKQAGFAYADRQYFEEFRYTDRDKKYNVEIENDVWIGARSTILSGVKIGNGAIVAAGALVSKNVPPYAIVGGVPAKIIKFRFSDEDIKWLLDLKWWDKDEKWLRNHTKYFCNICDLQKVLRMENK